MQICLRTETVLMSNMSYFSFAAKRNLIFFIYISLFSYAYFEVEEKALLVRKIKKAQSIFCLSF